jgi:parallel beta-helix repeat protein
MHSAAVAMVVVEVISAITIVTGVTAASTAISTIATTDFGDDDDCLEYDSSERIIHVVCDASFEELERGIGPVAIEDLGNSEFLLQANIEVEEDAILTIAGPEVKWVKISNEAEPEQYNIRVEGGYMDLIRTKMTSWDPDTNEVVEQDSDGSVPRPYIVYDGAKGALIENSELSHMGHDGDFRRGLSFIGESKDIIISNSDIHHFWYAFYSNAAENVLIDGNKFHDNHLYAIDPHTGTWKMTISNNLVWGNAGTGIICSLDCHHVFIEYNTVWNNPNNGINLSRNMHDSVVRYNTIYNSEKGIHVTESPNNKIYGNVIYNVTEGIHLTNPSTPNDGRTTDNEIYNNTIINADIGVRLLRVAEDSNSIYGNTLQNVEEEEDREE